MKVTIALDEKLSSYSFPQHPFSKERFFIFKDTLAKKNFLKNIEIIKGRYANEEELLLFHSQGYLDFVKKKEKIGGFLDSGDTPVFRGIFKAASFVVGTTLNCVDETIKEETISFNPIGGLHHAYPEKTSGFCVFNDIAIAINYLRKKYKIKKILYFDIDAHHGDGVFYSFIQDKELYIVDFHQRNIFPGTGKKEEIGIGDAIGTKLNIELEEGATDEDFLYFLKHVESFLEKINFDFIILQAGVDSLKDDPLTFLDCSEYIHQLTVRTLLKFKEKKKVNFFLILGGGGYNLENIRKGWIALIEEILKF